MKNVIFPFCFLLLISCKIDSSKTESTSDTILSQNLKNETEKSLQYGPNVSAEPYEMKLDIHEVSDAVYDLEIQMLLYNNAYYASSNSKKDFKGKFTFFIEDTPFFTLKNNLIETPLLIKQSDSESANNPLLDWIRVNTYYKQQLEIKTLEDFMVRGYIQFTIEPRCTLEKIPVMIKSENSVVKFEIDRC
ncbi:hypothetical protein [Flavobacterium sp. J27]|uniref:hypothetical protein n=1 Tax=Flavobacterium sp. J27 TaxID=2060419 RepID=UPI0010311D36|nr:hypothetical protein [Flavobacterium sp. J27]